METLTRFRKPFFIMTEIADVNIENDNNFYHLLKLECFSA
jgi:hypothetical protein